MPTTKNQVVSSSAIKELVTFGCSIDKYVPKCLIETITNKLESKPIYQPELSNYIFYGLGFLLQVDYNICNKIIKREALIRALNKIDYIYLNLYMTCHEDGMLNI